MSKKTFCLSLIWTFRSFITSVSFSLQVFVHLFATKEKKDPFTSSWMCCSRSLITSETRLILMKTMLEVFQAFSLFANGTAAYRLQVRQLLQLLSVHFVRFLKYKIHKVKIKSESFPNTCMTFQWAHPSSGCSILSMRNFEHEKGILNMGQSFLSTLTRPGNTWPLLFNGILM